MKFSAKCRRMLRLFVNYYFFQFFESPQFNIEFMKVITLIFDFMKVVALIFDFKKSSL